MMRLLLLIFIIQAWAEVPIPPPQNVQVNSALHWTSPVEHQDVKYTVQLSKRNPRVDRAVWEDVPGCVHTQLTTCNISSSSKDKDKILCVRLRVRSEQGGRTSEPVQACSHGDSCSPVVTLTPWPKSLTVHMHNNSLRYYYADHAQYRILFGREGEKPKEYSESPASSMTIPGLDVGVRYCVQVQYVLYHEPYGPPSCLLCDVIPQTVYSWNSEVVVTIVVIVLFLVAGITVAMAYLILKKHEDIKQLLQPPYRLPDHYHEFPELSQLHISSPTQESYDVISIILPGKSEVEELCDVGSSFTLEEEESGSEHASISSTGTQSSAGSIDHYRSKSLLS